MMAGITFLSKILDIFEEGTLPEEIKRKLETHLSSKETELRGIKAKYERLNVNTEQQFLDIEKELTTYREKLHTESSENTELKQKLNELEGKFKTASTKLEGFQEAEESSLTSQLHLTKANEQLESEKKDLTVLLGKKNAEIQRLNEDWKGLTEKLAQANTQKWEVEAKLSEIQSRSVSFEFQSKKIQQEKDQLQKQIEWLNKELNDKTKELFSIRKEQSSKLLELQSSLEEKVDEVKHLQSTIETLKQTNTDQTEKIDTYIKKLRDAKDMQTQSEEQFRQEIDARQRLTDLYKTSATEAEKHVEELTRAVKELQKLLKEAADAHTQVEEQKEAREEELKAEIKDREESIEKMKQELLNANDLIEAARKSGASKEQVEEMFPAAAATSRLLKSGMTLTQIYNEYVQASESLLLEKEENTRLNQMIDEMVEEVREKAPLLKQQRVDYEECLQNLEQMTKQLDAALLECQTQRASADEASRKYNYLERENHRLKQQTVDLSNQVQYLVKEVEELKGGRVIREEKTFSGDMSNASQVISERLVTFKDIQEMQDQNRRLLEVIRDLSDRKEQDEATATETRTKELKEQLERVKGEIEILKSDRERQVKMVESIVQQRDMYKVLLQQKEVDESMMLKTPMRTKSPAHKSPGQTPGADQSAETGQRALKQLQEEYDTFKKEMKENNRILNEQLKSAQQNLSDLRVQNAKLASQLDFAGERYKVLQGNAEGYRKEIAGLRDKEKKYTTLVAKHEQTINTIRQDWLSTQESLTRAEAQSQNLRTEKELLRNAEHRLLQELENLRRERTSQGMLMANLQAIQNSLEKSDSDSKSRYTGQIEKLELEVNSLRRKLNNTEEEHKAVVKIWENQVKNVRSQLDTSLKGHELDKNRLITSEKELQQLKEQLNTAEGKVATLENKLQEANTSQVQRDFVLPIKPLDGEEVKQLKSELKEAQLKVSSLTEQLEGSKQHIQQYKCVADELQQALKEQTQCSKELEERLEIEDENKDHLRKNISDLETQRQELLNENVRVSDDSYKLNADLRRQLSSLQHELHEAVQDRDAALAKTTSAVEESKQQTEIASEAQDKYQRELMLHAADVEALTTVKKQLENFNAKFATEHESRLKAERTLDECKGSWAEQEKILKTECQKLENRYADLNKQNSLLHQQMEKMSHDVLSIQQAVMKQQPSSSGADTSMSEDKSSEQLLEVVKFLRKEKEIAESKLEIIQAERNNSKQRAERLQKDLDDSNKSLMEQQISTQANLQTAAQHSELMRKVENLNILTDSNKLLREENNKLQQQEQELEAKVKKLETDINPLQSTIREISSQRDVYSAEVDALKNEVDRWKARTNHLIDQANKTDPEEHRKLAQEKEKLTKELTFANQDNHKLKAEISRLNTNAQNAQQEVNNTKQQITELKKEILNLKQQIEEKNRDGEEKNKTIFQLKKIGRKYKDQAEIITKELEDLKAKAESEQQTKKQQQEEQQPSTAVIEQQLAPLKEKLAAIEKERDELKQQYDAQGSEFNSTKEQQNQLQQELDKQKEELEKVQKQNAEFEKKHDLSKHVLQAAKKKIGSQSEAIEKYQSEINELKQKLTSSEQASNEEAGKKLSALKSQYESKISKLEEDLKTAESKVSSSTVDLQVKIDQLTAENTELQNKIQQVQKQMDIQTKPPQPQAARAATAVPVERARPVERASAPATESPKTANIKPMSSPAAVRPQATQSQAQAGSRVMASIRPMAIAPQVPLSVNVPTPTATVMPTTVSQHDIQDTGESVSQLSPVTATSRPTQQVLRVTPQVEAASEQPEAESSTSGQQFEAVGLSVDPQSALSVPSTSREITQNTQVTPTQSQDSVREGKRTREEMESQEDETEAKRTKVSISQQDVVLPSITVTDEHAHTTAVQTEADQSSQDLGQTDSQMSLDLREDSMETVTFSITPQESQTSMATTETGITVDTSEEMITPSTSAETQVIEQSTEESVENIDVKEEESTEAEPDGTIIIESDDEDEDNADDEDEEEDDEMGEYEEQDYESEDYEYAEDQEGQGKSVMQATQMDDDVVILDDDDNNEDDVETQTEEVPTTSQSVVTSAPTNVFGQRPMPGLQSIERQTSVTRTLTPFVLGGQTFEDGEDGIVPSTPTLYVPHRGDGYAEVVSSPQIPNQSFIFGSVADPGLSQPELAQLASQGALGMDDTRMDLSQFDEGGTGRSVPSTPLRTSAPVSLITEAAVASALISQSSSTVSVDSSLSQADTQTEALTAEVVTETQEALSPAQTETESLLTLTEDLEEETGETQTTVAPTTTASEDKSVPVVEVKEGEEKESGEGVREDEPTTSQQQEKSESAEKPKIQPIVWEGSPTPSQQPPQMQPSRGRQIPPRGTTGGMQRGGIQQQRGIRGGMYQRMRSPIIRGRSMRGNRGRFY